MNDFNAFNIIKFRHVLTPIMLVVALTACEAFEEKAIVKRICVDKTSSAEWILKCIKNGNPMSDEEGEDLVKQCEWSANSLGFQCARYDYLVCLTDNGSCYVKTKHRCSDLTDSEPILLEACKRFSND